MTESIKLKIAVQKSGRLNKESIKLLNQCGLEFSINQYSLMTRCRKLPIELLFVRDDDIPTLVKNGICDLGIVGENVLYEQQIQNYQVRAADSLVTIKALDFGYCRLSIAVEENRQLASLADLTDLKIATSYPNILRNYLNENNLNAEIIPLSGSVEIAPRLGIADAICDLVSTGQTLAANQLNEFLSIFNSQAVLIKNNKITEASKLELIDLLLARIEGAQMAKESKYIIFHAPKDNIKMISRMLPGAETPTIVPLEGIDDKMAVHAVSREGVFWRTLEKLKAAGASSILVMPIEKMLA